MKCTAGKVLVFTCATLFAKAETFFFAENASKRRCSNKLEQKVELLVLPIKSKVLN